MGLQPVGQHSRGAGCKLATTVWWCSLPAPGDTEKNRIKPSPSPRPHVLGDVQRAPFSISPQKPAPPHSPWAARCPASRLLHPLPCRLGWQCGTGPQALYWHQWDQQEYMTLHFYKEPQGPTQWPRSIITFCPLKDNLLVSLGRIILSCLSSLTLRLYKMKMCHPWLCNTSPTLSLCASRGVSD